MSHEFSAKTIDAAITEGLRSLGVSRNEVEIEVLHEGSRGLLGIGSTNARIRITLPPPKSVVAEPDVEPTDADSALLRADEEAAMHSSAQPEVLEDEELPAAEDPAAVADYERVGQEDAQKDARGAVPASPATASVDKEDEPESEGAYDEDEGEPYDYGDLDRDELAELATELLGDLIDHMGFDAEIDVSWAEGENAPLYLNIVGDDLGMLIGRHGETLASIQYLLRLMINQRIHRWTNIVIDVDGYKDRRSEQLTQMAQRMAEQVARTSRPMALEPMPANERRLIHMALRNHPDVYTESSGDADRRKVQILPK
jgi:spoIIIJ-associated protein